MARPAVIPLVLAALACAAGPAAAQANLPWSAAVIDDPLPEGWYVLDTDTIHGPGERESAISTTLGKRASMIGFRAIDGDLACSRISVSFTDGHSRWIQLGPEKPLAEGKLYISDLRDEESELIRVNYACETVAGTEVTLQVLAQG